MSPELEELLRAVDRIRELREGPPMPVAASQQVWHDAHDALELAAARVRAAHQQQPKQH